MSKQEMPAARPAAAGRDQVTRILGKMDDAKITEILALKPTLEQLEEAALWASGNGDVLAKRNHPLGAVVAAIVDIMTADEEEFP